jgi:ATP-dependent exoDNAse (exonuclease V) alpha subunit
MGVLAATIGAGIGLRLTTRAGGPPFSVEPANEGRRLIRQGDGGVFRFPKPRGELDNLVPAYACTIHKSQGSEYPAVVIPLLTQHYAMLQRNLVGQKKALAMAVKNHLSRERYTKLAEWLS